MTMDGEFEREAMFAGRRVSSRSDRHPMGSGSTPP